MVIHRGLISGLAGVSGGSGGSGGGSGTPLNPYQVWSANDLNQIREDSELYPNALESHYIQMEHIDLSGYSSGEGWNPIGTVDIPFKGSYDGNDFKISNLNINRPLADYQSLFGYCENIWYVKNITIENSNVEGKSSSSLLISRIVLSMEYDIINNTLLDLSNNKILQCSLSDAGGESGGIIGRISNYGNLDYSNNLHISFNNSNINGLVCNFAGYSGGILGMINIGITNTLKTIYMNYENIELTNININLSGNQYGFGFMLGYINHSIGIFSIKNVILDYCVFDGLNFTGGYCGGIAGNINSGIKIENVIIKDTCEWNNLSNNINSAGILSYSILMTSTESINDEFYIKNCYNYANINGHNYTGGIIGQVSNSNNSINFKIINCINYGDVNGYTYTGGIVGNASLSSTHPEGGIYNCVNYGNISGYNYSGGLGGTIANTKVSNCFSFGDVSGYSYVAGFTGNGSGSNIVNCYSIGVVSATTTTYVRGFFGRYGTYTNCYCSDRCGQTNSGGTGATIISDSLMRSSEIPGTTVYIGWDNLVWNYNGVDLYPILYWQTDENITHPYNPV